MSITTVTCEKQAVQNNPREEIAKANKKPIEYLYNYIKQINNDVLPQFNTTISHVTKDTVYYSVAVEYENYTIMTTSDQIDIAKQNAAQTLYYLLTDERIPESKYEDHTNIIPMELEKHCILNKIEQPMYSYIKTKISNRKFNCIAICKIGNLRYSGIGGTCLSAKISASIKALKSLTRKTT